MATFEGYERREAKILSVLKEYGITYEDIKKNGGKVVTNGFDDIANMVKDGQIDTISALIAAKMRAKKRAELGICLRTRCQ